MAAPKSAPAGDDASHYYTSPDVVPEPWFPDRPGVVEGLQPNGRLMGSQGPDQGYALTLANRLAPKLHLTERERLDDAIRGCLGIALRRASLSSRAPVMHDLTVAFTIWGYFDPDPPAELLARRVALFEGVGNVTHHYREGRLIADLVPEATLRLNPEQAASAYPDRWHELTGVIL